jgi:hypothetical protein
MDDIDRAQAVSERWLQRVLANRKPTTELNATGFCHNCYEPLADVNRRFCDADCRDDWQLRTKLQVTHD